MRECLVRESAGGNARILALPQFANAPFWCVDPHFCCSAFNWQCSPFVSYQRRVPHDRARRVRQAPLLWVLGRRWVRDGEMRRTVSKEGSYRLHRTMLFWASFCWSMLCSPCMNRHGPKDCQEDVADFPRVCDGPKRFSIVVRLQWRLRADC